MEEDNIMKDQAMPYIALFDQKGDPIIHPISGLPLGMYITDFSYTYEEDEDDVASITIETDDLDVNSLKEFKNKTPLIVQWGYIFPDGSKEVSQPRKVIIRDDEFDASESGDKYTFKCTDAFSLVKTQPADRSHALFLNWVKYNLRGLDHVSLVDFRITETVVVKQE